MNYFFEPVNLKQWDMFKKVKKIGHIEPMLATKEMKKYDIVLLHVGTQDKTRESGVYALGIVIKGPYILRNQPNDYCNNKNTIDLKIQYINYDKPIIRTRKDKVFNQYRTVHKLSQETINKIKKIVPEKIFGSIYQNEMQDEVEQIESDLSNYNFSIGEKESLVKTRIGQSMFKKLLLKKYDNKCCICNLANVELLVASHIKEWKNSSIYEKGDINNGLLLCTLHDSLFDRHLISFDKEGKIIYSNKLSEEDKKIMNLNDKIHITLENDMEKYMQYHRSKV